jgi:hypothetical protein
MDNNKLTAYIEKVEPLLVKLLDICKEMDIPIIIAAQVDDDRKLAQQVKSSQISSSFYLPDNDNTVSTTFLECFDKLTPDDLNLNESKPNRTLN